ncbi:MAG: hypothetical protein ABH844_03420 [Candidatus Omnitrophota bacterium]
MKRIAPAIIISIILTFSCTFLHAGPVTGTACNWYVVKEYALLNYEKEGFWMRTVERVYDEETAYYVVSLEHIGEEYARRVTESCVSGKEYDEALENVFKKCPLKEAYIALIDIYGYETVVDFLKVPPEFANTLSEETAKYFEKSGAKDVQVIYPAPLVIPAEAGIYKKKELSTFTVGDTSERVEDVQGIATSIVGNVWFYDTDMVVFDSKNKVADYSNFSGKLKTE